MGSILDSLMGKTDDLDTTDHQPIDFSNVKNFRSGSSAAETLIHTATVTTKQDVLRVEELLQSGDIILAEIGTLQSGLTREQVATSIKQSAEDVDGDIAWRTQSELIASPRGVGISREEISS